MKIAAIGLGALTIGVALGLLLPTASTADAGMLRGGHLTPVALPTVDCDNPVIAANKPASWSCATE